MTFEMVRPNVGQTLYEYLIDVEPPPVLWQTNAGPACDQRQPNQLINEKHWLVINAFSELYIQQIV